MAHFLRLSMLAVLIFSLLEVRSVFVFLSQKLAKQSWCHGRSHGMVSRVSAFCFSSALAASDTREINRKLHLRCADMVVANKLRISARMVSRARRRCFLIVWCSLRRVCERCSATKEASPQSSKMWRWSSRKWVLPNCTRWKRESQTSDESSP